MNAGILVGLLLVRRVALVVACLAVMGTLVTRLSFADEAAVPPELQADLLSKLVGYDRNFETRAKQTAHVLLLVKSGDARSGLSAASMKRALDQLDRLGGLPHDETIVSYEGTAALTQLCRSKGAALLYVTPGFDSEIEDLRAALVGVDVLSVSAVPDYVPRGIVLGFELVSGRPRILLNLQQAKLQNVNFKADVLKLMKVFR